MKKFKKEDFMKVGERYLLKNSNAIYYSKEEMEKLIAEKKVVTNEQTNDVKIVKKTITTTK